MFSVDTFRHTAVYREAFDEGETEGKKEGKKEGRLDAVPLLLELGAAEERIARDPGLDLEAVREVAALVHGERSAPRRPRPRKARG
jgi:predicted transposase YdaD